MGKKSRKRKSHKRLIQEYLWRRYARWQDGIVDKNKDFHVTVWQEVPPNAKRTAARVVVRWSGILFDGIGFATLNIPAKDVWDAAYGRDMAIKKAISNVAWQIAGSRKPPMIVEDPPMECSEELAQTARAAQPPKHNLRVERGKRKLHPLDLIRHPKGAT